MSTWRRKQDKTLIVTGQNNHKWEVSHVALKRILENSGQFRKPFPYNRRIRNRINDNYKLKMMKKVLVVIPTHNGTPWIEKCIESIMLSTKPPKIRNQIIW